MLNLLKKSLIVAVLLIGFTLSTPNLIVQAQSVTDGLSSDPTIRQQQLQAQLNQLEKEIADQTAILTQKKTEGVSITRDIAILDAKIAKAKLEIKAHGIAIQQLGKDITVKTKVIGSLNGQINEGKESLASIIRQTDQIDRFSLPEILLSNTNFSDFFADIGAFDSLKKSMQTFFGKVKSAKAQTEIEKKNLGDKRNREIALQINVEEEQRSIEKNEADKKKLLSLNKKEQTSYQSVISTKQQQAAAIRDALFGLRDAGPIKFGLALQYAQAATLKTGVRPAFLLAILTQETNLGANIGSCYVTDSAGNGVKITSGAAVSGVMKGTRDVPPFLELMSQLGRNSFKTPVSCPQLGGYGGGMGPSQFIPSTWKLMVGQISAATGKSVPDPYNASDAFIASSLYLSNLGASGGTAAAERNAACKYYSGKSCTTTSYNGFYGDSVMKIAAKLQANIDILQNN